MSEPTVESKPRVLMVDDSKVIRMAANKILGKDFDVVVAADGEEGWQQLLDDHSIHVVFTDLMMPVLDGLG
ncbi:MAG TPA: response regulator, partial [Moraxellaceae bacterium]|nr:response regulator [Moraxellaceae bacterium]HQV41758.1 response regulator [Moraxellaceae bacterium]